MYGISNDGSWKCVSNNFVYLSLSEVKVVLTFVFRRFVLDFRICIIIVFKFIEVRLS